jgi:hypothetical protein
LPTWDPITGDLYFFLQTFGAKEPAIKLYRIPADELTSDTEPELIRDLSFVITTPTSIYNIQIYSLDGGAAISPDGAQMAFLVRTTRINDPENGVWLIDLDGGSFELLATDDDLRGVGLPEWANEQGRQIPESVGWINNTTLAVVMIDESLSGQLGVEMSILFIDTVEREITPAKDFSDLPDDEALFSVGDDGYAPSYDVPRADVILPNEETILYFNRDFVNSAFGASMIAFGSGDFTPIHIVTMTPEEFVQRLPMHRATVGDDGETVRALLHGYLFTFERN